MEPINVVAACDSKFVQHLGVTLSSLLTANPEEQLRIFVLTTASESETRPLRQLCSRNRCTLELISINEREFAGFPVRWHLSIAAYFRLLIGRALPADVEKAIYLDSDVIVRDSLSELWRLSVEDHVLGAMQEDDGFDMAKLGLPEGSPYFNSGVLIINLRRWREERVAEDCFALLAREPQRITYADQCALNIVLHKRWKTIDPKWNLITTRLGKYRDGRFQFRPDAPQLVAAASIVHFSNHPKPWDVTCEHPARHLYWDELARTPWRGARPHGGLRQHVKAALQKHAGLWDLAQRIRAKLATLPTWASTLPSPYALMSELCLI